MRQPAFTQPPHRRPAWAKTETMYRANISANVSRPYGPRSDFGLDNFSYDTSYLAEFNIPDGIVESLSPELRRATSHWIFAAAALAAALDRIHKLDGNPIVAAETAVSTRSNSIVSWSELTSAPTAPNLSGPDTPATSPPTSFSTSFSAPFAKPGLFNPGIQGMDTPPFTPFDTRGPNTPAYSAPTTNGTMPDPLSLDVKLAPLTSPEDTLSLCSPVDSGEAGDNSDNSDNSDNDTEKQWENYAKTYNAEVHDLKHHAFPRFAGLDRTVNKLLVEMEVEGICGEERKIAVNRYQRWWRSHRGRVAAYQAKVDMVHAKFVSDF